MKLKSLTARLAALLCACGFAFSVQATTTQVSTLSELTAAVSSASAGDTIQLTADIDVNESIVIDKSLILNLNGQKLVLKYSNFKQGSITNTEPLTVMEGTIVSSGPSTAAGGTIYGITYENDLTLRNVTVSAESKTSKNTSVSPEGKVCAVYGKSGNLVVENCTLSSTAYAKNNTNHAYGIYIESTGGSVSVSGSSLNVTNSQVSNASYGKEFGLYLAADVVPTIENSTIQGVMIANTNTKNITLGSGDLSNDSLSGLTHGIDFAGTGTLTIAGIAVTAGAKTGSCGIYNRGTGTVVIENGSTVSSTQSDAVNNYSKGTVVVNGGTLTTTYSTMSGVRNNSTGSVTINGGTVTGGYGAYNYSSGSVTINGGTVTGTTTGINQGSVYNYGTGNISIAGGMVAKTGAGNAINANKGTVEVSGGMVDGTLKKGTSGAVSITGGIFSVDPTTFVASDSKLVDNTDDATKAVYPYKVVSNYAAKIGEAGYNTLAEALTDVTKDAPLTWVDDTVWPSDTPVYYNGVFYAVAGTTQNGGGALDHAIAQANADHASSADVAKIYVRPGYTQTSGPNGNDTFLATYNKHQWIESNIIIYGNNASLGGERWEPDVETYHTLTKDVSFAIYNLHDGAGVWGTRESAYTFTITLGNCTNAHEVLITRKGSNACRTDVTITNCTFDKNGASHGWPIAPNTPGTWVIEDCSFANLRDTPPINFNNKHGGELNVTMRNCTFTDCGTQGNGSVIRLSGTAGTVVGTLDNLTFSGSGNKDIVIGNSDVSKNVAYVTCNISNTACTTTTYYREVGTSKDETLLVTDTYTGDNDVPAPPVAQIGETTYPSLAEAVAAAQDGDTIEVFEGTVEISNNVVIPEGVTIKGEGAEKTAVVIASASGDGVKVTNPNVTISNMTIDGSAITSGGYNSIINVKADGVVIDGVVMKNGGKSTWNSSILVEQIGSSATFTVKNSTISGSFRGVLRESCNANIVIDNCDIDAVYPFNIDGGNGGTVTVKDSSLHGWTSYSGIDSATFTNCEFSKAKSGYDVVAAYVNTTFTDCEFDSSFDIYAQTSPFTFSIIDCTKDETVLTWSNFKEKFPNDPDVWNKCTCLVNGINVNSVAVAQIGETTYGSLAEAVAAAQNGETITMLADVDLGTTGLVIAEGKNFTLDIGTYNIIGTVNGKLITNNGTIVVNGTTGCIYNQDISAQGHDAFLNNGTATINGGWFGDADNDKTNANAINRGAGFRNFGTATINGGHFTACDNYTNGGYAYAIINGNDSNNPTLTINNADVYGKNNGNIANNSGSVTVKDGTFDVSGSQSYYSVYSYSGNTVVEGGTFTKSGNSNGQFCVEVDNDNANNPGSIAVSGGYFTEPVIAKYCAEGVLPCTTPDEDTGLYTVRAANYVAQIGSTKYETLEEAVAAVADGETITMLANSTESGEPVLARDISVTLDLNGKTVTANGDIWVKTGSLTVVGSAGSAINSTGYAFYVSTQSIPNNVATLTINSNDVTIHGDGYGIAVMSGGVVNLQAGSVTSTANAAICNNGSNKANTTINITGGTVSSDSTAIYHPGPGTLTVGLSSCDGDDGHSHPVIAGKTGVEMRAGTLNVYCGDITATATEFAENANGSGPTIAGAAIAVSQHTTDMPISVAISGGTLNGIYGVYEKDLQNPTTGAEVSINVTGGTISGTTHAIVIADIDSTTETVRAAVSGGYFSDRNLEGYLVEGKLCTTKADYDHLYQVVPAKTVTFYLGTGAPEGASAPAQMKYPAGDPAETALPLPTYTSSTSTFVGWKNAQNNTWAKIPAGTDEDLVLTATWESARVVEVTVETKTPTVKVTESWIESNENLTKDSSDDAIKAELETTADNGLKVWQNYVLGQDTTKSAAIVAAKDSVEETKAELDMTFNVPAVDTGFDVKYRVDQVVGETVTEGAVNSVAEIDLDAATTSKASAFFQVKAVLTPKGSTDSTKDVVVDVQKTVGVVKVDSAAEWTIVAVPWESLGTGAIKASELIHLGNRSNGDELRVYTAGAYQTWKLQDGNWVEPTRSFKATKSGSQENSVAGAGDVSIPRGAGVWLKRVDPTAPIYLLGQKPTTAAAATTLDKPDSEAAEGTKAWNLVASPNLEKVDVAELLKDRETTDKIIVPTAGAPKNYTYDYENKQWGYDGGEVVETEITMPNGLKIKGFRPVRITDDNEIPAGTGFWYLNGDKTDDEKQINW